MAKRNDLTNDEILARIQEYEQSSYGAYDSELSAERAQAIDRYLGKPLGNEIEGRSQVVSSDVSDTVEAVLPQLVKIFCSGDKVVEFTPRNADDIEQAEQETEVVNFLVSEKGKGFATLYTWFKDALLSKNGYVKVQWEEKEEVETETYKGLTDDEFAFIAQSKEVEIVEHTAYPDELDAQQRQQAIQQLQMGLQQAQMNPQAAQQVQQMQAQLQGILSKPEAMLHDVKVQTVETRGEICIEPVAPESMRISVDTKTVSLADAPFVQHVEEMDEDEIEEMGFEVPENAAQGNDSWWEESNARDLYSEGQVTPHGKYEVKDTYMRVDGQLMRYVVIGNQIVLAEEAEVIPFASLTPIIMPHRHIGRSLADLVMDIQAIKSYLIRGQIDNIALANSPRFGVSERVNLDDLLTSRPGGLVRTQGDPMGAIMPLQSPVLPPQSFQMVEYLDHIKEQRTGVTSYNQGLDANSLNKTASGISQIMSAAQERVLLIARIFAETGVKELYMLVHKLTKQHSQREMIIRLRNEFVTVDPRTWKTRYDMSITVGLGTGNKSEQLMHLTTMYQMAMQLLPMGLATPKGIYSILEKITTNSGFKNPEEFWSNPESNQLPPAPPNPLIEVEKIKQQGKMQEVQLSAQIDQQKFQANLQQEQLRSQNDVQIEQSKVQAQMQLEQWKAELQAATDLKKEQMRLEAEIAIEQFKSQNDAAIAMKQHQSELGSIVEQAKGAKGDESLGAIMQGLQAMIQSINVPKQIIRDPSGRAVGVAPVQ